MPRELLERLTAHTTFIVGKGGVGKTTVSGWLALSLADAGVGTHLLSTDPAHSLGDLFERDLPDEPTESPCGDRLILEEMNAPRLAETRLEGMATGLRELIERGTYLDEADADMILSGSLPGLDEIGAALRIVELAHTRLVVDTAPTGHLLRLLDTPSIVRSWVDVFDAMADKADTVASALVGRPVRLSVEKELDALLRDAGEFEAIINDADFVVVTGAGRVEAAETGRLVDRLRTEGRRVAATVAIDRPGAEADVLLPWRQNVSGCEGLRSLWSGTPYRDEEGRGGEAGQDSISERGVEESATVSGGRGLPPELDRGLVVFAGKGGVGKSTCAAATAVRLAESGPVLLLSADPAGSLKDILNGDTRPDLEVRELDGEAELERLQSLYADEVADAFAALGLDRAAAMDRAVVESLWQLAPPGVDELMGVSRLAAEAEAGTRIVVDSAPTGHFLRFMAMPDLALDWVRRLMRILLKYSAMGDLDAPAGHLLRFARRFRELRERLVDGDRTAVVVVSLDEPMVRAETARLVERLRGLDLPLAGVVINRASGHVASQAGAAAWRAPEVAEPRGVVALQDFIDAWERVP